MRRSYPRARVLRDERLAADAARAPEPAPVEGEPDDGSRVCACGWHWISPGEACTTRSAS